MKRKPANLLSTEMLNQLREALLKAENDKLCKALVLTSSLDGIFCGGLDLTEYLDKTSEYVGLFWSSLQQFYLTLYQTPLITIAAINGHAPAGGCLLAMSCDYRLMCNGPYTIGLNETQFGLVAPPFFVRTMINTIGFRQAERLLQFGELIGCEEALKIGLIDEISSSNNILERSAKIAAKFTRVNLSAKQKTKEMLRGPTAQALLDELEEDINRTISFGLHEKTQKFIATYLSSLRKRAKSNKSKL